MAAKFRSGSSSARININNLPTYAIGAEKVADTRAVRIQGIRDNLTSGVEELLWHYSPTVVWPDNAGEALVVVSDDAGDAGVEVEVDGLDENFDLKTETVTCNGLSNVDLTGLWSRINNVTVRGTQAAVGTITVSGSNVFGAVNPEYQQSLSAQGTVPNGYIGYVGEIIAGLEKDGGSRTRSLVRVYYRERKDGVFKMEFPIGLVSDGTTVADIVENFPVGLLGPVDYYVTAESDAASTEVVVRFQILLELLDL